MTSAWDLFLSYAKAHPHEVPKDMKQRAKLYNTLMAKCKCGMADPLCSRIGISAVVHVPRKINTANDPDMLKAKVRALEEIVREQDAELRQLRKRHSRATA